MTSHQVDAIQTNDTWGRATRVNFLTALGTFAILTTTPFVVFYFYIAAFYYDCSLMAPLEALYTHQTTFMEMLHLLPPFSWMAVGLYAFWLSLQIVLATLPDLLHKIIPAYQGGNNDGSVTPAGNRLEYKINGLQAWVISHILFVVGSFGLGAFSPTIIFDYWGPLLWVANILGLCIALFVYAKAHLFPSYPADRKFSGNMIYDFFMGVELNPRIGPIDFKLFFNGRPGIVAWTLINISFAAAQYSRYGFVSNSMLIVNLLQALYVLYFFWKEAWYLKTIDIHHDHFGWMLAWGDLVWLPYMYTLQALFLVFQPVVLSTEYALFVLALGLIGFYIFAAANNQKDRFRSTNGKTLIWGKKPEFLNCHYTTQDGGFRESKLLLSGWWGIARHTNYAGDLILSLAYSLACGLNYIFPYFYFIFLTMLLVHRCLRDEGRCGKKYGKEWVEYCDRVPYRIIPYVW